MYKAIKEELNSLLPKMGIDSIEGKYTMRFELGGEGNTDRDKRIQQATLRGSKIYQDFIGNDEIIVLIKEWESNWFDTANKNIYYLYQVLSEGKLKRLRSPFKLKSKKEDSQDCDIVIGKTKLKLEQVQAIIKGIASYEMGEKPCISQSVYFFSIKKRAGFRIYDDRGCDVWADSIKTLRPLYEKHNAWILDYNRTDIDKMFHE